MPFHLFKIENVIGFCCDFFFSWLDESNILELHHLADLFGLQQLNARLHSYMLRNIQTLSRTDVYRQLPEEQVFKALCSDELQVNSENEVYEAALHYHYSPEQVETDQVYLQVSLKVCLHFIFITLNSAQIRNTLSACSLFVKDLFTRNSFLYISHPQDNLKMLEAVRFCLIEKQKLQRVYGKLSQCPLKDSVSSALQYHEQELWQPVLQSPLTQPRSTFHCILGFGGMFSSHSDSEYLFQVFHPSWGEWRTLPVAQTSRMSNQGIAVLNNFVYLIGGDKNTSGFHAETRCWR